MSHNLNSIGTLSRILDTAALRHRTIAQNVANVNTPGYTRFEVRFESELADQSSGGPCGCSGAGARPQVVENGEGPRRADGNNVSLEQEMTDLNKNTLLYTAASQFLASRLAVMRSAVSGQV